LFDWDFSSCRRNDRGYGVFLVWAFQQASFSPWVTVFISVIFLLLLIGLVVSFVSAWKEISQEDKDDYRNY